MSHFTENTDDDSIEDAGWEIATTPDEIHILLFSTSVFYRCAVSVLLHSGNTDYMSWQLDEKGIDHDLWESVIESAKRLTAVCCVCGDVVLNEEEWPGEAFRMYCSPRCYESRSTN